MGIFSASGVLTTLFGSIGNFVFLVVGSVIVAAVGLLGIGFAFRLIQRHVTGRADWGSDYLNEDVGGYSRGTALSLSMAEGMDEASRNYYGRKAERGL